jgi:AmiR/NasT family two-component response regulator
MKTILQNGSPVQTSIVVVTAFSNQSAAEECEKIGIKAVIHKPLTFDKL